MQIKNNVLIKYRNAATTVVSIFVFEYILLHRLLKTFLGLLMLVFMVSSFSFNTKLLY